MTGEESCSVHVESDERGARYASGRARSGCPNCGADPDSMKEREDGPDGIWGSHVCVACGAELYEEADRDV